MRILDITKNKTNYAQDIITVSFSIANVTEGEMVMYNNELFIVLGHEYIPPTQDKKGYDLLTLQKIEIKNI